MKRGILEDKYADPRSTSDLIRLALAEPDEDLVGELVSALHRRGTREVLEAAELLCDSASAPERELGATLLGQLGVPERAFPDECFACLERMLDIETDADTLQAIAIAFGHLKDPRSIDLLLPLKSHPSDIVRWGVANGLSGHNDPAAIRALIDLSTDIDEEIRDWAAFGLGSLIDTDTPEIRDALWARVSDFYEDARAEALVGLARRKDPRVLDLLQSELANPDVDIMAIDAAQELGDIRLLPALLQLKDNWPKERREEEEWLDRAIASCTAGDLGQL
jgi:HEAT repeat protein